MEVQRTDAGWRNGISSPSYGEDSGFNSRPRYMSSSKRTPWSKEEIEQLRQLTGLRISGAKIAKELGRSLASVTNKQEQLGIGIHRTAHKIAHDKIEAGLDLSAYTFPTAVDQIPDWLDQLRPV